MLIPEGHWACAVVMPYRRVRFWGWNSSTSLPAYRSITITPPLMIINTHDMFRNNTTTLHRVNLINIQQTHWSNSCSIAWSLHTFDLWSGVLWNVAVAIISSIVTLFPSVFFQKSTNRAERSAGGSEKTPHRPWNYTQLLRAFKNPWPQISKHTTLTANRHIKASEKQRAVEITEPSPFFFTSDTNSTVLSAVSFI